MVVEYHFHLLASTCAYADFDFDEDADGADMDAIVCAWICAHAFVHFLNMLTCICVTGRHLS